VIHYLSIFIVWRSNLKDPSRTFIFNILFAEILVVEMKERFQRGQRLYCNDLIFLQPNLVKEASGQLVPLSRVTSA
jgi:hypothetical protein